MNLFDINYRKLTALLLPTFLRKPVILSLLRVITRELENARRPYTRFKEQRDENLFYLRYNSQVCHLRAALNEHFRIKDRADGFEIEEAMPLGYWLYAYRENDESDKIILAGEEGPREDKVAVAPVWVYRQKDIEAVIAGFTVLYPKEVIGEVDHYDDTKNNERYDQMEKLVNYFRLVSREPEYIPKDQFNNLTI